jgi:pyrroline-5-carboxylate reductase
MILKAIKLRIGIIGIGNMGQAIARGILKSHRVYYNDIDKEKVNLIKKNYPVLKYLELAQLIDASEVIILSIKPQDMKGVLCKIKKIIKKEKLFISIAAGVTTEFIESKLDKQRVIRVMPNMAAIVKSAITAITLGKYANRQDLKIAKQIFSKIGRVIILEEDLIDAVTAISGSGPGFLAYILECLKNAGVKIGLNEEVSQKLVFETFKGTANLFKKLNLKPEDLVSKVASKGGTTEACLKKWEELNLANIIEEGIVSAHNRAKELSK